MDMVSDIVARGQSTPLDRAQTEVPRIVAPGPWIAFAALAYGLAFDYLYWIGALAQVPSWLRNGLALLLIAAGGWMIFRANVVFRRVGTAFEPWKPSRTLAACGIYACTRNPMYQGFFSLVLGIAIAGRSDWTVLLLLPTALLLHYGVVLREELYLEGRFGESYRNYKAAVSRYGWPFGRAEK